MNGVRKTTPTKATKNMEHRQYRKQSWVDHTSCQFGCTNPKHPQNVMLSHHQHWTRRHCPGISMVINIQTTIQLDQCSHKQKSTTSSYQVSASARTQVTARLFTGAQQESSASCTSSQVKYRVII